LKLALRFCLKFSEGFKKVRWTARFAVAALISFALLNLAVEKIPLGTAYAIWTGIGAAGTAILGILFFRESANLLRVMLIIALIGSVVGLKWFREELCLWARYICGYQEPLKSDSLPA
jgi:quaternary ammonium compound-resistance protein SugE